MCRLWIALAVVASLAEASICPDGYSLMGGSRRCVRPLDLWKKGTLTSLLPDVITQCEKDGAHLPIIRSAIDQAMFNEIVSEFDEIKDKAVFLLLGMVCNKQTRRLEWEDGSAINFIQQPPKPNIDFDCVENEQHVVSRVKFNDWFVVPDDQTIYTYTFMCEIAPSDEEVQCGNTGYELMPSMTNANEPCFKFYSTALSWNYAERVCAADSGVLVTIHSADENNFFRRTAVTKNLLNGVHIGAHQSAADPNKWTWIDGEVPITNKDYQNFADSFPVAGGGGCVSMQTSTTSSLWINEDCNTAELPFICRRRSGV